LSKKSKLSGFQVLLLDNGEGESVEVQEGEDVDFGQVKEHLRNGGSVFITSKGSQKMQFARNRSQQNYCISRRTLGFLFRRGLRN